MMTAAADVVPNCMVMVGSPQVGDGCGCGAGAELETRCR